jgi:hypothetical protein
LAATISIDGANCTLIDAITAANDDGFAGGCAAGSGADTIVLPPNSIQTLTEVNNSTFGPTGLPAITSVSTISGNGSTITRDPNAPESFRILAVGNNGNLVLQDTTVSGGQAMEFQDGAGVLNDGTLTLVNSRVSETRRCATVAAYSATFQVRSRLNGPPMQGANRVSMVGARMIRCLPQKGKRA